MVDGGTYKRRYSCGRAFPFEKSGLLPSITNLLGEMSAIIG
ncbi:hypothetical protein B4113_1540 [Geobacillus sp. B4113_201601]|nr:hypothetical protein B4113_1540 [Geobacillus sp. B4113_201601]